jgi:hypothetical protein
MPMIHTIFVVPVDIEHVLVWTRLPIIDFPQVPTQITSRLYQDGLWGFTGCSSPPPSPSTLPLCLPALADWNVTIDKLIRFPKATLEEDEMIKEAGREIDQFVRNRWIESEFETAWFVNPPVGPPCACPDPPILSLLLITTRYLHRGFKAFRSYPTFMSSFERNLRRRSHAEDSKLGRSFLSVVLIPTRLRYTDLQLFPENLLEISQWRK